MEDMRYMCTHKTGCNHLFLTLVGGTKAWVLRDMPEAVGKFVLLERRKKSLAIPTPARPSGGFQRMSVK